MRLKEALDSFEENRKTQREQKNTVDQGTEDFGALPAVRVVVGALGLRKFNSPQSDDEGEYVIQLHSGQPSPVKKEAPRQRILGAL